MLDGFLHNIKRCSTRFSIEITCKLTNLRPSSHLGRESNQQGCTTHQCGIEEIIAQASKRHLGHTNGEQRTDNDNPDGKVAGEVETEQQTSQDS